MWRKRLRPPEGLECLGLRISAGDADVATISFAQFDQLAPFNCTAMPLSNPGLELSPLHRAQQWSKRDRGDRNGGGVVVGDDDLDESDDVDGQKNDMEYEHRIYMVQRTVGSEQEIAADRSGAQGHHRAHAESRQNAGGSGIAEKAGPQHYVTASAGAPPRGVWGRTGITITDQSAKRRVRYHP